MATIVMDSKTVIEGCKIKLQAIHDDRQNELSNEVADIRAERISKNEGFLRKFGILSPYSTSYEACKNALKRSVGILDRYTMIMTKYGSQEHKVTEIKNMLESQEDTDTDVSGTVRLDEREYEMIFG